LLEICFAPSLAYSIIFLTLTRLVVVIIFENFSFALFTPPPLDDFQFSQRVVTAGGANWRWGATREKQEKLQPLLHAL
jgi:hypothetical protein